MRITRIRIACLEHPLDPPFLAARGPALRWSAVPTPARVERRDLMLATPIGIDRQGRLPAPPAPGLGIEPSTRARAAIDAARPLGDGS